MEQINKEDAIAIYKSEIWKNWTDKEKVKAQLFQDKLFMPFGVFHEAVEKVLGRSVWTHEFGSSGELREEYNGLKSAPTLEEIFNLIPEDKRIIIRP